MMFDMEIGIQFLRVLSLEKSISELEQQQDLEFQEQILTAKLKVLQCKPQLSCDELEDLRFRVQALEHQVQRLEKHVEDENVLPVRERYLQNRLRQLIRAKERPVLPGCSNNTLSLL